MEWEVEMHLKYHAVTAFADDLIIAVDNMDSDYGDSFMLLMVNKFRPAAINAVLVKKHLVNKPSILRVMHGGLQAGHGWFNYPVYTIKQSSSKRRANIEQLQHTSCRCILNAFAGCLLDDCSMFA